MAAIDDRKLKDLMTKTGSPRTGVGPGIRGALNRSYGTIQPAVDVPYTNDQPPIAPGAKWQQIGQGFQSLAKALTQPSVARTTSSGANLDASGRLISGGIPIVRGGAPVSRKSETASALSAIPQPRMSMLPSHSPMGADELAGLLAPKNPDFGVGQAEDFALANPALFGPNGPVDSTLRPTGYDGIYMRPPTDRKGVGRAIAQQASLINSRARQEAERALNPFGSGTGAIDDSMLNRIGASISGNMINKANQRFSQLTADGIEPGRAMRIAQIEYDIERGVGTSKDQRELKGLMKQNSEDKKLKEQALEREAKYGNEKENRELLAKHYQDQLGLSKQEAETKAMNATTDQLLAFAKIKNMLSPEQQMAIGNSKATASGLGNIYQLAPPAIQRKILAKFGIDTELEDFNTED